MKFAILKEQWDTDLQGVRSFFEQAADGEAKIESVEACLDDPQILDILIAGQFSQRQISEMDERGWGWGV